uniref:F-box domain-containing protein n=1 Tax=Manihot esculenta TaxID=3983 RepID=A0A2C9W851_MANES
MSDYLPQELLLDIFHRLPNTSIGRCMCVCKYWLSLIKNPSFVSSHIHHTILPKKAPMFLLKLCSNQIQYSLHFDNKKFSNYKRLGVPLKHDNRSFSVIGSSNGLVCLMHNLYTYNYTFVLWNPLIRKSLTLPKPNVTFESHGAFEALVGFGFDACSEDYKVVRVVRLLEYENESEEDEELAIEVEIFSLNRNSWNNITGKAPQYDIVERGSQAFVNGTVHWIATQRGRTGESNNLILGLDLVECLDDENPMFCSVFNYMDSTVAVVKRNYINFSDSEIWVMKKYGVTESWTKLLTVGRYEGGVPRALGFRRNGDVLFELFRGEIVSVNPESLQIEELRIHSDSGYSFADTYVESLALLELDQPRDANEATDFFYLNLY